MAVFAVKSGLLKVRRSAINVLRRVRKWRVSGGSGVVLGDISSDLYGDGSAAERGLQLGKVQNLRVAARALNGVVIPADAVFSFWAQVGRPTRGRGYVEGRELRQGCLIPSVAGGLCQMSNSLHAAAKAAGCEIIERHGHTAQVPGSPFPQGEDATVFWNYVDLRFRPRQDVRLRVMLSEHALRVAIEAVA